MVDMDMNNETAPVIHKGVLKRSKVSPRNSDAVFDVLNYAFFAILVAVVFLYPLIFIVSASLSNPDMVFRGEVWLFPKGFTWLGYETILKYDDIWMGYRNSLLYVVLGVPVSVMLTLTAAYPLSRKDFMLRNPIMAFFAFTMFFAGGLVPTYLLVRSLGLIDSILVMVIGPGTIGVWNIIITRTFFQKNIPTELAEAAQMDGCSDFRFFTKVVLPLSAPIIAVITLFYAVGKWNNYFIPLIYFTSREKYSLQLILREIIAVYDTSADMLEGVNPSQLETILNIQNSIKYGSIIVASLPVLMLYPLIQRYFVRGIMIGAIKG